MRRCIGIICLSCGLLLLAGLFVTQIDFVADEPQPLQINTIPTVVSPIEMQLDIQVGQNALKSCRTCHNTPHATIPVNYILPPADLMAAQFEYQFQLVGARLLHIEEVDNIFFAEPIEAYWELHQTQLAQPQVGEDISVALTTLQHIETQIDDISRHVQSSQLSSVRQLEITKQVYLGGRDDVLSPNWHRLPISTHTYQRSLVMAELLFVSDIRMPATLRGPPMPVTFQVNTVIKKRSPSNTGLDGRSLFILHMRGVASEQNHFRHNSFI